MVFELILSGLCAFVLSPCEMNTKTVSAVFPAGPFNYSKTEKYPEHHPTLTVDITDVDPSSTAKPYAIIEQPDGTQFAVFEISGAIILTVDDATPSVKLGPGFEYVTKLSEVVSGKPEIGELRDDLLKTNPNKHSRTHLTLPFSDSNGAPLTALSSGQYDFPAGTKDIAERVRVKWDNVATHVVFKDRKGKTIILRDPPANMGGDGAIKVVMSSYAHHFGMPSDDLEHFPSYFFLSRNFKELKEADRAIPKKHTAGPGQAAKPIACAICVGCGG